MPNASSQSGPLDCNADFVFNVPGQRFTWCGVGLCDVVLATTINGMLPIMYQKADFTGTVAEDGDPISFAAQTRTYFNSAIGDPVPGNPNLSTTLADSNLSTNLDGAAAPNGMVYIAVGWAWLPGLPYVPSATGADPIKVSPSVLNPAPNGPNYTALAISGLLDNVGVTAQYSDTGVSYYLGAFRHAPFFGGARGPVTTSIGQLGVPAFMPFVSKLCMGGPDSNRSIQFTAVLSHPFNIESNGSTPMVSPPGDTVYFPIELILFGSICCVMDILKSLSCQAQPNDVAQGGWALSR